MFVCMFVQRVCVCALRGLAAAAAAEIERLENQCVCEFRVNSYKITTRTINNIIYRLVKLLCLIIK